MLKGIPNRWGKIKILPNRNQDKKFVKKYSKNIGI